jgi:hypothetical protein
MYERTNHIILCDTEKIEIIEKILDIWNTIDNRFLSSKRVVSIIFDIVNNDLIPTEFCQNIKE